MEIPKTMATPPEGGTTAAVERKGVVSSMPVEGEAVTSRVAGGEVTVLHAMLGRIDELPAMSGTLSLFAAVTTPSMILMVLGAVSSLFVEEGMAFAIVKTPTPTAMPRLAMAEASSAAAKHATSGLSSLATLTTFVAAVSSSAPNLLATLATLAASSANMAITTSVLPLSFVVPGLSPVLGFSQFSTGRILFLKPLIVYLGCPTSILLHQPLQKMFVPISVLPSRREPYLMMLYF